jgi:hypothetical protein
MLYPAELRGLNGLAVIPISFGSLLGTPDAVKKSNATTLTSYHNDALLATRGSVPVRGSVSGTSTIWRLSRAGVGR